MGHHSFGRVNSSPVIASDGTIYIGSADLGGVNGHVYAINPDGTQKWDFIALGPVHSSAAIAADGTIYIGSDGPHRRETTGYLYSIDSEWDLKIGSRDLFGHVKSSPAIGSDGTIYVGSDKEDVFAYKCRRHN